jgi:hypothetical protein
VLLPLLWLTVCVVRAAAFPVGSLLTTLQLQPFVVGWVVLWLLLALQLLLLVSEALLLLLAL